MKICIRDDDTGFITKPTDLENAYGELWGQVPITLAVIPFTHGGHLKSLQYSGLFDRLQKIRDFEKNANAKQLADYHRLLPVGDNPELIGFLNPFIESHKIEVALHGYNHRYYENGAEFINRHIDYYQIRDGKEYLEKLFNINIETFIPPSNRIDLVNCAFLNQLDLNLFISGTIITYSKMENIKRKLRLVLDNKGYLIDKLLNKVIVSTTIDGLSVTACDTFKLNMTANEYFKIVEKSLGDTGKLCIATHYQPLNEIVEYKSEFYKLINMLIQKYPSLQFKLAKDF